MTQKHALEHNKYVYLIYRKSSYKTYRNIEYETIKLSNGWNSFFHLPALIQNRPTLKSPGHWNLRALT